ncbi:MAG: tripartite tricarboxylate transporter substrate binding protein [Rhodoferax sp.]|nr:tripartite tricarboxylate transporter substrate binding protein [Rhodoferax sp.]
MKSRRPLLVLLAASMLTPVALAQSPAFPERPIRVIVPFAPGGATDAIARVVGKRVSELLGQPVLVENKAGASGNIGAALVARAAPDGYTILMGTSSHAINASLFPKLDYRLTTDLVGVSQIAAVPLLLVVHPGVPARTPNELAAHAKANEGKVNFASGGTGTAAHLAGEQFNTIAGIRMTHVAYKGGAPAQTDLIGGQVQAMFANLPEVLPHVQAGKLRAVALTGQARSRELPQVPTFAEAGFAQLDAKSWFGWFAPAATPAAVLEKLSGAVASAVADPAVQARLQDMGAEPVGSRSAAFQPYVVQEVERWRLLVQRSGASAD